MAVVRVPLTGRAYDIVIAPEGFGSAATERLHPLVDGRRCLVVSDTNVAPLYAERFEELLRGSGAAGCARVVIEAGEQSKNLGTMELLYEAAVEAGLDRRSLVVALGGGVVGDSAGFLAASYMRGVRLIQIPTSLLAQVDSAVGGKTGVDLPQGKNLVGAFHQPSLVLAEVPTLRTLPSRELRCGLGEVIKYGVILDAEFFRYLEQNVAALLNIDAAVYERVIVRSCELKARVVLEDEREGGVRAILNYGHTFGHALERVTGYAMYSHGEAVAIGMGMAADLACLIRDTEARRSLRDRQDRLLGRLGLPTRCTDGVSPDAILEAMATDKKFESGRNRFILPNVMGEVEMVRDVDPGLVLDAILGRCSEPAL